MVTSFGFIFLCALTIFISPCLGFFDMFDYYDSFQEQRYGCQTEGGYCLDMYPPPQAAGGAGGGEPQEVEHEGPPTPQPVAQRARAGAAGKTPGKPGATAPPATPAPPRQMVQYPMHYIRQNCMSFDFDYFSCGRTGGVCCYQRP
ncbi:uncharacterized protein [Argopecten irradians]|uniref:uncharacterized protein isoform X2 n=1 Tax=Argopecten irradians TaxID=31199 RepID=UPI003715FDAF